ncbi:MAG TPA: HNH endonuclease, partial [Kofleriaceae bacterium]|nr:HNH endonuclease [Kofleriaceae bacterium]
QALLRRQIPDGDLAAIVERAMSLLLRELERVKFAATASPRKSAAEADPTPRSRHIPDPIRREVWQRDEGQCTFHDRHGRRCPASERLEFHHVAPFGRGGDHSVANVRLVCSIHNAYQAELDYGAAFMAARRRRGREDGGRASEAGWPRHVAGSGWPRRGAGSAGAAALGAWDPAVDNWRAGVLGCRGAS